MNVADTLAPQLRLTDAEELTKNDCLTPTGLDYLGNYRDGTNKLPFVVRQWTGGAAGTGVPNAYQVVSAANPEGAPDTGHVGYEYQSFQSYENNSL